MTNNTEFRTCPDTGLLFHKPAETLMKLNAVAGIVFAEYQIANRAGIDYFQKALEYPPLTATWTAPGKAQTDGFLNAAFRIAGI